jgi:hypothetical protein
MPVSMYTVPAASRISKCLVEGHDPLFLRTFFGICEHDEKRELGPGAISLPTDNTQAQIHLWSCHARGSIAQ